MGCDGTKGGEERIEEIVVANLRVKVKIEIKIKGKGKV
jgi:hypothetical protein